MGFFDRKEPIMADETQNAPVAGAEETATQQKVYIYYFSTFWSFYAYSINNSIYLESKT